ncbi:gluconokinase [Spirillospora albida]|uniref:gluconokinase n=1 Tax=Spirillospora albida TaxID=58123 RepID=UPI0004BFE1FB|nr:gluconokinase [Spirillospora albida]
MSAPEIVLVAGVSGSGKTTVGRLLAHRLGWDYAEADDFHSPANVAKMRAGTPLTDADRGPWLDAIAAWADDRLATGRPGVVTCSALKRAYRARLTHGRDGIRIVLLDGDPELLAARIQARSGHFFDPALLESQLATLEPPAPGEDVLTVSVAGTPDEITDRILRELALPTPA